MKPASKIKPRRYPDAPASTPPVGGLAEYLADKERRFRRLQRSILRSANIAEIIGKTIALAPVASRNGAEMKGCCPFHKDKTPSFYVSTQKAVFNCRGCGASGNVIRFYADLNGIPYELAVERMAQEMGIEISEGLDAKTPSSAFGGAPNIDANQTSVPVNPLPAVIARYQKNLQEYPRIKAYLAQRGISESTLEKFSIGYCPGSHIKDKDKIEELVEFGVMATNDRGSFEIMRNRIVIPIRNAVGEPIALAGRVLEGSAAAKYINTRETKLFSKAENLFGLDVALPEIRAQSSVVMVEGYMDVMMLWQHDIKNVCGLMGTSVRPETLGELWRIADTMIFCLDGDGPGRDAAFRNILASASTMTDEKRIIVAILPLNTDPDEYVKTHGSVNMMALLNNAMPLSEFAIARLLRRNDMASAEGRASFRKEVERFANSFANAPILREEIVSEATAVCAAYAVKQAMERTGITNDDIDLVKSMATSVKRQIPRI